MNSEPNADETGRAEAEKAVPSPEVVPVPPVNEAHDIPVPPGFEGSFHHDLKGEALPRGQAPPYQPAPPNPLVVSSPPAAKRSVSRSKVVIIGGCLVGVLILIVAGSLALKGGGAPSQSTELQSRESQARRRYTLIDKPKESYSVELIPDHRVSGIDAFGTPDRFAVKIASYDLPDQLYLYNRDGEVWSHEFDGEATVSPVGANFFAHTAPREFGPDGVNEIRLVNGRNGEKIWSNELKADSTAFVHQDKVFVVDGETITVYSLSDGSQLQSKVVGAVYDTAQSDLERYGQFFVYADPAILAVDANLDTVTTIVVPQRYRATFVDGKILLREGANLTLYGADGKEIASEEFDPIEPVVGFSNSTVLYNSDWGCGLIDFSTDKIHQVWHDDKCWIFDYATIGEKTYATIGTWTGEDVRLIDAETGEELMSPTGGMNLEVNGVLTGDGTTTAGYSLPDQTKLFSESVREGRYFREIEGGYLIFEGDNSHYSITVYS